MHINNRFTDRVLTPNAAMKSQIKVTIASRLSITSLILVYFTIQFIYFT